MQIEQQIKASIAKRCKASAASGGGWGQDDSLGVLGDALQGSKLSGEEISELVAGFARFKLFNPSQAHQLMQAAGLLPKTEKKKRGSTNAFAEIGKIGKE